MCGENWALEPADRLAGFWRGCFPSGAGRSAGFCGETVDKENQHSERLLASSGCDGEFARGTTLDDSRLLIVMRYRQQSSVVVSCAGERLRRSTSAADPCGSLLGPPIGLCC